MSGAGKILQLAAGAGYGLMLVVSPPPLERSDERDDALRRLAAVAGDRGWTVAALRQAAGENADLLFPGGRIELIEAWADLIDREMTAFLRRAMDEGEYPRLSQRVRHAILERLALLEPYRAAERQAVSATLSPCARAAAARVMGRTVNAIWQAAEDMSGGVTWATKRVSLASIYAPTFSAWLGGADRQTVAHVLDGGLARARRLGELKRRILPHAGNVRAA